MSSLQNVSITDVLRRIALQNGQVFEEPTAAKRSIPCISPTHDDKTASLHVSSDDRVFFCHGKCNEGGGIIKAPTFFGITGSKAEALAWLAEEGFIDPPPMTCPRCRKKGTSLKTGNEIRCRDCGFVRLVVARKPVDVPPAQLMWTDPTKLLPEAAQFRRMVLDDLLRLIGSDRSKAVRREIARLRTKLFTDTRNERLLQQYAALREAAEAPGDATIPLRRRAQLLYPRLFLFTSDI